MKGINHELLLLKFFNTGLSYEKLAQQTQISRATLYNVMFGVTKPSHQVACGLIHALLLTPEEIMTIFFPNI